MTGFSIFVSQISIFLPGNSFHYYFLFVLSDNNIRFQQPLRIRGCTSKCITTTVKTCCPENKRKQTEGSEWELNTIWQPAFVPRNHSAKRSPVKSPKIWECGWHFPPVTHRFWGGGSAEATRAMRRFLSSTWRFFRPGCISATAIELPWTVFMKLCSCCFLRRHQENRGNWRGRFGFTRRARKKPGLKLCHRWGFNNLSHDPVHTLYIHDVARLAPVRAWLKGQTINTHFVDVSVCQLVPWTGGPLTGPFAKKPLAKHIRPECMLPVRACVRPCVCLKTQKSNIWLNSFVFIHLNQPLIYPLTGP